jgi:hypothetical protein
MRHFKKFEFPYDDGTFWFRNFVNSIMLSPFTSVWWLNILVTPLALLVIGVLYEVLLRKWLTIQARRFKNFIFGKKKEAKNE